MEMTTHSDELDWNEMAVLCAVAAGASLEEISRSLDAGEVASRAAVDDLERRGFLRPPSPGASMSTPPSPIAMGEGPGVRAVEEPRMTVLTDLGRQYLLTHISHWTKTASKLEEERRHVERLRTDLLSTISHELRTPLTLIRTSIGLLLDSDPDEEMRGRLLRNIKQSTDRMNVLVTDLLDLARIRGDRFELQIRRVDPAALVSGAVSLMQPLLDEKQQQVEMALPAAPSYLPGDSRRLERVLLNLLGNAIKFADAGTRIVVTVRDLGDDVQIAVQDNGPGIPEEAMPHLFDQFFTARTSSSRFNIGAGLGLPIAKGIIEAHGGRIWVESEVGTGTTVSFALPKAWPREGTDEDPGG